MPVPSNRRFAGWRDPCVPARRALCKGHDKGLYGYTAPRWKLIVFLQVLGRCGVSPLRGVAEKPKGLERGGRLPPP